MPDLDDFDQDDDDQYTPGEGLENDASDAALDTSHGPVGDDDLLDEVDSLGEPEESDLDHDEFRAEVLREIESETDLELPRQRDAEPTEEPLSNEAEARLAYDDTDSGDAEVSEQQLTEQYRQQKADAELAAHRVFLEKALADARAAREAAQRPPQAPQVEVVPPPLMAQASEAQFEAILAARAQGLDSLPSGEVADLPAFYGSLIHRNED